MAPAQSRGFSWDASLVPTEPGLLAHCKRVAYLTRVLADRLELAPELGRSLEDAALFHHAPPLNLGRSAMERLREDLAIPLKVADDRQFEGRDNLRAIVRGNFGGVENSDDPSVSTKNLRLASDILEACNCFDETMEFAPFDGISIAQAIDMFGMSGDPVLFRLLGLFLYQSPARCNGKAELRRIERLPVLPRSTQRLLAMHRETANVAEVDAIAKSDQVLATAVISTANSALYGRMSEAKTIRDAIVYLGIPASCDAMLAASLQPLFASATLRSIWKHATEAALVAQSLARATTGIHPEEAFLAGLVHDIGRLVVERFPYAHRRQEAELLENGFPMVYAEAMAYRTDHAELGAELLRRWYFSEPLVTAVRYHHRPEAIDSPLASLLYLTENVCEAYDESVLEDLPSFMRRGKAAQRLGLTLEQIGTIGSERSQRRMAG